MPQLQINSWIQHENSPPSALSLRQLNQSLSWFVAERHQITRQPGTGQGRDWWRFFTLAQASVDNVQTSPSCTRRKLWPINPHLANRKPQHCSAESRLPKGKLQARQRECLSVTDLKGSSNKCPQNIKGIHKAAAAVDVGRR